MKLLIDLTSLYDHLTGIERFASNISSCLIKAHPEHSYELLFKKEVHKDFLEICGFPNVRCHILRCRNRVLFNQFVLPLKLYRIRADLYFFPAFCAPWLFFSGRIVDTIHDMSDFECFEGKAPLKVLYSRLGILHAKHCFRHIVTVSEFSRDRISGILGISQEKISVVPNGVSEHFVLRELENVQTQRLLQEEPASSNERTDFRTRSGRFQEIADKYHLPGKYLLSVSTLEPRKNLRLLIDAFLRIKDEFPDLHLVLCGRAGWNLPEVLGEQITGSRKEQISDRIHITGFVEDKDLPYLYAGAEWFVFPSKYEGFGIPPLEAMGMGCPVISSDAASLPEVLGDSAIYFSSNHADSLAEQLRHCVRMPEEERKKWVGKGASRPLMFTWENSAERLNDIFGDILEAMPLIF